MAGPGRRPPLARWECEVACAEAGRIGAALLAAAREGRGAAEAVATIAPALDRLTRSQRRVIARALLDGLAAGAAGGGRWAG
jgi:hypothetical protein